MNVSDLSHLATSLFLVLSEYIDQSFAGHFRCKMSQLAALLKPPHFVQTKSGDPDQLLQDWMDYTRTFRQFLKATGEGGQHTEAHADCEGCGKVMNMLRLIGGREMELLLDHVGAVLETDTLDQAFSKVETGIKTQSNQAVARHKLMQTLSQGEKTFASWYPLIKEQAKRCDFTNYDVDAATRDAILFKTSNIKLKQKILAENLNLADTIKYGLALEQSKSTAEALSGKTPETDRLAKIEEAVRAMSAGSGGRVKCDRCTFPTHAAGKCPAVDMECFDCNKIGNFAGAKRCQKKNEGEKQEKPKKREKDEKERKKKKKRSSKSHKSRSVQDKESDNSTENDSDTDSSRRVLEEVDLVRAVPDPDAEIISIGLSALDHGVESESSEIQFVLDTGVNKTLVTEEDWKYICPKQGKRKPKLKRTTRKFTPYGTRVNLECLGRTKVKIRAKAGATIRTMMYVIRGVKESLIGRLDAKRLGLIVINEEGAKEEQVRKVVQFFKERNLPPGSVVSGGQTQKQID